MRVEFTDFDEWLNHGTLWREWAARQDAFIGPPAPRTAGAVYYYIRECHYCGRKREGYNSCPGCGAS